MSTRVNQVILIVGNRGTGKTVFAKKLLYNQIEKKMFPKVGIFDEDNNDTWDNFSTYDHPERINFAIPQLPLKKFKALKSGVVKLTVEVGMDVDDYIRSFSTDARNMILLIEDASRFLEGKLSDSMKRLIYNSKQRNVDLYITFHSLQDVPPRLARSCNWIILFKTEEEKTPSKLSNPRIKKAFEELKVSKNQFDKREIRIN